MKLNRQVIGSFVVLVLLGSLYRVVPHGDYGFPPQLAMAVFAGAIIRQKAFSFLLPLASMLASDLLFQWLFNMGWSNTPGFYQGQWINYLLICSLTIFGFGASNLKPRNILVASVAAPTVYFILSNFVVWASGGGFARPKSLSGLLQCYADGLPFYYTSLAATIVFSAILFGAYRLLVAQKNSTVQAM